MDYEEFLREWRNDSPTLMVRTSGSTGEPKAMLVEKRRMQASARITCNYLGLKAGDTALLCLPLDYIAGKMMVVRALTCGMTLLAVEPSGTPEWNGPVDLAAMVPLQVWNLLRDEGGRQRLMTVRHLIIGGGAIDDELQEQLKDFPNQVWSTYGMTETLSHIALRRLNGPQRSGWYTPFEGVQVSLGEDGCLVISAPAVCDRPLHTHDIAQLDGRRFRILGRSDNVVCSGGIKIQIEEVERLLRSRVREPYLITSLPDKRLGETIVMLTTACSTQQLKDICREVLPRYYRPTRYITVDSIPQTPTGKPARAEARQMAMRLSDTYPSL